MQDILAKTEYYPESLNASITTIRNSLPMGSQSPSIKGILIAQEAIRTSLASRLENLADHYDQMVRACRETEAGEQFSEEDLQGLFPAYTHSSSRQG
jgi:autophagy-related protein 17